MDTFFVSIRIDEAICIINNAVIKGSITGECIDKYTVMGSNNTSCTVLVYEKHFYRVGNRLTLTVIIDNFESNTRVHSIGGGGGEGLFSFDWGAADKFSSVIADALEPYRM